MDWSRLIRQFQPLEGTDVPLFAPPRETEEAIAVYNKAVFNLQHDNSDVAIIALRKLTATHPLFAVAALLLGYCLADLGSVADAREQIQQAILAGLPDRLQEQAQAVLLEISRQASKQKAANAGRENRASKWHVSSRTRQSTPTQAILQKTSRRRRVRVASARERQAVILQGEQTGQIPDKTTPKKAIPQAIRIALPVLAGVLVLGTLIYGAFVLIPRWTSTARERSQAQSRLNWLLNRLQESAGQDPAIERLLDEFEGQFNPSPTPVLTAATTTLETTGATSTASTTATTAPTTRQTEETSEPTTTETTGTTISQSSRDLQQADRYYQEAVRVRSADLLAAADNLLLARQLLGTLAGEVTAPGVQGDASALSASVEEMIAGLATTAAYQFWLNGYSLFEGGSYPEALEVLLKAFDLNPNCYGGGAAYYCGRCYQLQGAYETAKPFYEYVVDHFAGRDIAASAAARLEQMGY